MFPRLIVPTLDSLLDSPGIFDYDPGEINTLANAFSGGAPPTPSPGGATIIQSYRSVDLLGASLPVAVTFFVVPMLVV